MAQRLNIHGMLFQAAYWFGFCTYMAFMVTTLIDYGWSASAATGAMTAMSIIIMLVHPIYGYVSDKYLSEKKLSVLLQRGLRYPAVHHRVNWNGKRPDLCAAFTGAYLCRVNTCLYELSFHNH